MGSINFSPQHLADVLSEGAGYKAGLALSVEQLCDVLTGTTYPDSIRSSEAHGIRLRSEVFEDLFYSLLEAIGFTEYRYQGFQVELARWSKKYVKAESDVSIAVAALHREWVGACLRTTPKNRTFDPSLLLTAVHAKYGSSGRQMAVELVGIFERGVNLNPLSIRRYREWDAKISLDGLYKGSMFSPEIGTFIDQRYLNFLSKNPQKLGEIHWRKFEELTSEFFHREGYVVEIGPGSNDDGVDVRIWNKGSDKSVSPLCLVQCKRTKAKVEKVIVKALASDVLAEDALYGLIVTTSELSPGAATTISTRAYPITQVRPDAIKAWLDVLKVPGTGIVRI
jgi:restriction system protein